MKSLKFRLLLPVIALFLIPINRAHADLLPDITPPKTVLSFTESPYIEDDDIFISTDNYVILNSTDPDVEGYITSGSSFTAYLIDISPDSCGDLEPPISTAPAGTCENYLYTEPFTLPLGSHTLHYQSFDNAENEENINTAYITVTVFASLSGSITITPILPQGTTVTVIASTEYFLFDSDMFFSFTADGASLPYSISLPAPATYFIGAVEGALTDELPSGASIGIYNDYAPIYLEPDVSVSNINFTIAPDYESPTLAITSIIDGSTLTALSYISGTASDNIGVDSIAAAAEDITAGLWWNGGVLSNTE